MFNVALPSRWKLRKQYARVAKDMDKNYNVYLESLLYENGIKHDSFKEFASNSVCNHQPLNLERYSEDFITESGSKRAKDIGTYTGYQPVVSNEQKNETTAVLFQGGDPVASDDSMPAVPDLVTGEIHGWPWYNRYVTGVEKPYQCRVCKEVFESRQGLSQHIENGCLRSAGSGGSSSFSTKADTTPQHDSAGSGDLVPSDARKTARRRNDARQESVLRRIPAKELRMREKANDTAGSAGSAGSGELSSNCDARDSLPWKPAERNILPERWAAVRIFDPKRSGNQYFYGTFRHVDKQGFWVVESSCAFPDWARKCANPDFAGIPYKNIEVLEKDTTRPA